MTVHGYRSQRDLAESMRLVSDSATVTDATPLATDRSAEIRGRLAALADEGLVPSTAVNGTRVDWEARFDAAGESGPWHRQPDRCLPRTP